MWPALAVIGRVQIQERAGFPQYPALKGTTMDGRNSFVSGGCSSVGIKFDAGQVRACIFGDVDQSSAFADTRVDSSIRPGRNQECPNVLGFFDRQWEIAEFDASSIAHHPSLIPMGIF